MWIPTIENSHLWVILWVFHYFDGMGGFMMGLVECNLVNYNRILYSILNWTCIYLLLWHYFLWPLKCASSFRKYVSCVSFYVHRVPWWNARKRIALRPRRNMVNWKRPSFPLVYMRKFDLLLLKTVYCTYSLYNLVLFLLYRVNRMLKMGAR